MGNTQAIVCVVDDDMSVRDALQRLIRSVGWQVELFGTAQEFLRSRRKEIPTCLVLDIRLPGMSGLDLQRHLEESQIRIPVIFITAHGDIPMCVNAMKRGAIEFLSKPFRDQDLLDAIHIGLQRDQERIVQETEVASIRGHFESLTEREREVVRLVVAGLPNKVIADQIGVAENTVKVHRSHAMDKMEATSLANLVKMISRLGMEVG